ncbi:MAG: type VI secretion system baseplate subunit TssK [Acetobacteraceae bacterium]|nr:type VI secretion system baseplate subunit TssK [Acetobacteraceae bacterium]
MTWTNRVVWQEGMFLRAQHFQQQDRHFDQVMRAVLTAAHPYPWGVTNLTIDRDLLATGRFAVSAASGLFQDGTSFAIPEETDHPVPLEFPETARNAVVYLGVPIRQLGAVEMSEEETKEASAQGRYAVRDFEAYDTHSASPQPAPLLVGRLRLRYLLETDDRSGYLCIGLARVTEVTSDRRVILDDRWVAPCITSFASPSLVGLVTELSGMLHQRGEALAARLTAPAGRGVSDVADFLLLQTVNRWQSLMAHWADSARVHPLELYRVLLQMAGEFATFTETTRRPNTYAPYRHEDLQRSFAPVVADLRRALSAVMEQNATAIPLQERRQGVRVGPIMDRAILRASSFVLSVQADMPTETLRRLFPAQVKIGAVEHIRELVNVALPGITIRPLPVAPRQIPFHAGASYFELDRNSPHWQQMQSSGGFAIHVSGEFPNLRLELWAIRG